MATSTMQTAGAFHELLDVVARCEERFAHLEDETTRVEGYRWALSILQVGAEVWLYGDSQRPRFVDIVGPTKKWGGDNTDAAYMYAPIDPRRTYRVRGERGDAVYLSLTVYGGPDDGRYSTRIIGSSQPEGDEFEIVLGPGSDADIHLAPDAVAALTRDYRIDPERDRRATWRIECLDGEGDGTQSDAEMARRMRAVATWVEEQAALVPVAPPVVNGVAEPYPVPTETFGWAAGDAAYAFGGFDLDPDEALLIRGASPACRFWNLCLWTPYLHTYDAAYDRVTINGGQVRYEPDGSWEIVVAGRDPGHPNWISTQGHRSGLLWFRWFLPAHTPVRPTCQVVPI